MTIGEKIKHFRSKKGITQERIASELHISYQAVSKWERNESLPDVIMIPKLAEILDVSCDALLIEDIVSTTMDIDKILSDIREQNRIEIQIEALERGLEKYPNNERIIVELIQAYSKATDLPNYKEYRNKLVKYAEYILASTSDLQTKYDIIQMLCYVYRDLKEYDKIVKLAMSMPRLEQCREALFYHSMPNEQYRAGMKEYAIKLINTFESILLVLANCENTESLENTCRQLREQIFEY